MANKIFFSQPSAKQVALNQAMDSINQRYGYGGVVRAHYLERLSMPDVIAPAWRPTGPRATIDVNKRPKHSRLPK